MLFGHGNDRKAADLAPERRQIWTSGSRDPGCTLCVDNSEDPRDPRDPGDLRIPGIPVPAGPPTYTLLNLPERDIWAMEMAQMWQIRVLRGPKSGTLLSLESRIPGSGETTFRTFREFQELEFPESGPTAS